MAEDKIKQIKTLIESNIFSEEITHALWYAIDCMRYTDEITGLNNCNTCKHKDSCSHSPRIGEITRINCFLYEK